MLRTGDKTGTAVPPAASCRRGSLRGVAAGLHRSPSPFGTRASGASPATHAGVVVSGRVVVVAAAKRPGRYLDRTPRGPGPQVGNFHTLAHGANSERLVIPDAEQLADEVFELNRHLADRDRPAVLDYAIAQIRAWRFAHYLERVGDFDSKGRIRPAVEQLRKWLQRAETARARLGLDPVSYASLNLDRAETARIATQLAETDLQEGRRLRVAAERRDLEEGAVEQ
jgi:hypothetical protein